MYNHPSTEVFSSVLPCSQHHLTRIPPDATHLALLPPYRLPPCVSGALACPSCSARPYSYVSSTFASIVAVYSRVPGHPKLYLQPAAQAQSSAAFASPSPLSRRGCRLLAILPTRCLPLQSFPWVGPSSPGGRSVRESPSLDTAGCLSRSAFSRPLRLCPQPRCYCHPRAEQRHGQRRQGVRVVHVQPARSRCLFLLPSYIFSHVTLQVLGMYHVVNSLELGRHGLPTTRRADWWFDMISHKSIVSPNVLQRGGGHPRLLCLRNAPLFWGAHGGAPDCRMSEAHPSHLLS